MRSVIRLMGILLPLVLCLGCPPASRQTTQPVEVRPVPTERFITINFKADPSLNLYDGSAHALHVCVYQLVDPNPFYQLSGDETGLSKLMRCDRFDPGVGLANRFVIQPGEVSTQRVDRAEGVRQLGIVAGYFNLKKDNVIRMAPVSVGPMSFDLYLGSRAIQDMRGRP